MVENNVVKHQPSVDIDIQNHWAIKQNPCNVDHVKCWASAYHQTIHLTNTHIMGHKHESKYAFQVEFTLNPIQSLTPSQKHSLPDVGHVKPLMTASLCGLYKQCV